MLARTIFHLLFVGSRGRGIPVNAVQRSFFRVWPTDIDFLGHMNNGKYLSIMDVARFDLLQRSGVLTLFRKMSWYPVVVAQTISYRKSLKPFRKFAIESRILGFDERSVYIEQRFTRRNRAGENEIYAKAVVRGRILRRGGGPVDSAEVLAAFEGDVKFSPIPENILGWAEETRLPSTRSKAVSDWGRAS